MAARLERIVYRSDATVPTDALLNLAGILAVSQRNNARDGLTGALAAHEGRFHQVIEGQSDILDQLLRRLDRDGRHRSIEIIDRRPIESRSFAGWSMASARITPEQGRTLDALAGEPDASAARIVGLLKTALKAAPDVAA